MTFVRTMALAVGMALLTAGAWGADLELEPDRYETPQSYDDGRWRDRYETLSPDEGERWRDRTADAREDAFRRRYADDEDELGPVPPRNVGPRVTEERRYGSFERDDNGRRFATEGDGWHRRVVGAPPWQGDPDCRTVVTRRYKPWGEVVERRKVVCD